MTEQNNQTETFKHHSDNLRNISEKLRTQEDPDIDELLPLVTSAQESYKVIKDRVASVRAALQEVLPDDSKSE